MTALDEDLSDLAPQIGRMVRARAKDVPHLWEDLTQEAMIAAWQERAAKPDAPVSHAVRAAQFRVSKVVGGKPFTGEPRHPGRQDAHDTATHLVRTSKDGEDFFLVEPVDASTESAFSACEVRSAIVSAVRDLDDLDALAVHLRFWEDREWADVAKILGRPAGTVSRRWTQIVRPALAEALAEVIA